MIQPLLRPIPFPHQRYTGYLRMQLALFHLPVLSRPLNDKQKIKSKQEICVLTEQV